MRPYDLHQNRQRSRCNCKATLATHWRKSVRVLVPRRSLIGKRRFYFGAGHLLPAPMRHLAQAISSLHFQGMRRGKNAGRLNSASKRRSIDGAHWMKTQTLSEAPCLFTAFVGKSHIGCAGKTVLRRQHGSAVANEEDASVHHLDCKRTLR